MTTHVQPKPWDETIAETWHDVREAKLMVDRVEIQAVVSKSVDGDVPPNITPWR